MQIKTTLGYCLTSVRIAKTLIIAYAGEDEDHGEHSTFAAGNANLYSHFGNHCGGFSGNSGSIEETEDCRGKRVT